MKTTYLKPVLDLEATGKKIKTLMIQKGITARQLQVILGFEYVQGIYAWTQGKNAPSIDNLLILSQVFGVQMDDIIQITMIEVELDDMKGVEALRA